MILIYLFMGYIAGSLMEYLLHRLYLHRPNHSHLKIHHVDFFKTFEDPSASFKGIASKPAYILTSSVLGLVLSLQFMFVDPYAFIIWPASLLYLLWVEFVHYLFHSPKGLFIERFSIFTRLKSHHHQHHLRITINYGIGSSLIDHIFKTKGR